MFNKYLKILHTMTMLGVLSACGVGSWSIVSGDTIITDNQEINTGTVPGYGSVYINGKRFDTGSVFLGNAGLASDKATTDINAS